MTDLGFGDEPYMTVPERRAAAQGHPAKDTPNSFWHVCCGAAWCDNNPDPSPCWLCGSLAPLTPLAVLFRNMTARGSEHCPTFNGEHTTGTLY
jgi:hypothetical protein